MCTPCVKASSSNKRRSEKVSVDAPAHTCVLEVCRSNLGPGTDDPVVFRNSFQLLQATGKIMPDYARTASFSILSKSSTSHQSTYHLYVHTFPCVIRYISSPSAEPFIRGFIKSSYRATRFDHKMILFRPFNYMSIITIASSFLFGYTVISILGC